MNEPPASEPAWSRTRPSVRGSSLSAVLGVWEPLTGLSEGTQAQDTHSAPRGPAGDVAMLRPGQDTRLVEGAMKNGVGGGDARLTATCHPGVRPASPRLGGGRRSRVHVRECVLSAGTSSSP